MTLQTLWLGGVLAVAGWIPAGAGEALLADKALAVLAEHCFECHGPNSRKGGLRLSTLDDALLGGDSGRPAFVRGDSESSAIIAAILERDPNKRMPADGPPLSAAEVSFLRAWIDGGAGWPGASAVEEKTGTPEHWAFRKPVQPRTPAVALDSWPRNAIDRFVLARLETEGLQPSPEADRRTLIRRVSLELTGLPPTPEAVEAFIYDHRPDAYERLVDGLLSSPHYGERQARRWLDVARYADTNGYEKDRPRSIWPYRDWVIEAFNADLPFDRFVVEQMAGDLLPNATEAQRVATGFHRNTMLNEEGGIDAAEDFYKATVDRVNTTATAFLGLTMSCAQCHTHKYDPITQREFFEFFAFLNNAAHDTLVLADPGVDDERRTRERVIRHVEDFALWRGKATPQLREGYEAWSEETAARSVAWEVLRPLRTESANGATLKRLDDESILAMDDLPNNDVYTVEYFMGLEGVTGLRLEVLPDPSLPGHGPGRGVILSEGDFLLTGISVEASRWGGAGEAETVTIAEASESFSAEDHGAALALDGRSDTGWSIKDGEGRPHSAVFSFAESVGYAGGTQLRVTLRQDYIHQHTIGRFRVSVTRAAGPVAASGVPAEVEAALLRPVDGRSAKDEALIARHYFLEVCPDLKKTRERLASLREELPKHSTTLVLKERETPRVTRIHHRGEFLEPRDGVTPGVPEVLHPLPESAPRNRLTLAHWLVSEENPLMGRVVMNRLWQQVFGRGLVTTPEDFGVRGATPSHPELLDWLAVEFMRRGWSLKEMHRLMVTSAAFRQVSRVPPGLLERDPENVLLARGPRFRAEAEVIRDITLAASGLLNPVIGGPSVYPPQPAGVTSLAYGGPSWPTSTGPDRYRRSLYTYWKRTAPFAAALTFDAPTGEETCVARRRTNTPLQALTLLNDEGVMDAARALARRVLAEGSSLEDRVHRLFALCLSRPPDQYELRRMSAFVEEQMARLAEDPAMSQTLLSADGSGSPFGPGSAAELGAWTLASRVVLNLDETITKE